MYTKGYNRKQYDDRRVLRRVMDKTKLLSIGTLSKLTGVHIKSLRYYDAIGVLPPTYVDPDTGYRYYSFPQIHVADAISLCLELDIPLKQFSEFIDAEKQEIYFAKLLAKGTDLAQKKSIVFKTGLIFFMRYKKNLRVDTNYSAKKVQKIIHFPKRRVLRSPM